MMNLAGAFLVPKNTTHRQYEALRNVDIPIK